jgi:hypothetical protein
MIRVKFDPDQLTGEKRQWWMEWEQRAQAATHTIIEKWENTGRITTIDFDDRIWGELKVWLLKNVFNNKCAYCETPLPRQSGHAEHFRPKGGVKYKTEKKSITAFTKDALENQIEHPGYFWLAYNWKNLLPSCELCNAGGGKKNQFPCKAPHLLILPLTNAELANIKEPPIASGKWPGKYYLKPGD